MNLQDLVGKKVLIKATEEEKQQGFSIRLQTVESIEGNDEEGKGTISVHAKEEGYRVKLEGVAKEYLTKNLYFETEILGTTYLLPIVVSTEGEECLFLINEHMSRCFLGTILELTRSAKTERLTELLHDFYELSLSFHGGGWNRGEFDANGWADKLPNTKHLYVNYDKVPHYAEHHCEDSGENTAQKNYDYKK